MLPMLLTLATACCLGAAPPEPSQPAADSFRPDPTWKPLGKSLWFDPGQKRLVMRARVVLRDGPLEHLICLKGTKEHEAILATDAAPRLIHAGLILTGAEPGHPVRFLPKFEPPTGPAIGLDLHWEDQGKSQSADARQWVFDERKKAALTTDWVFAGSEMFDDPDTKQRIYAADEGDLVTVSNFATSTSPSPAPRTTPTARSSPTPGSYRRGAPWSRST
jgi:hypothetical protein